jgi:pimeloyl-ACP methyl ester carboxylesterase
MPATRRSNHTSTTLLAALVALTAAAQSAHAGQRAPAAGHYASVNGLNMYYETHGSGMPLVLLHGGGCTIDFSFSAVLPSLARHRKVIAVEQQAHGHTPDIPRPLSYEQMAEDTAALLSQLKVQSADFLGWSDGGNIALLIAIRHPTLVRKLAVTGANYNNDGMYAGFAESVGALVPESPRLRGVHEAYDKAAPDRTQWPGLIVKLKTMWLEFKGCRPEDLRTIQAPVLVMVGDSDAVRPEHALEMFRLLPHASLAVLPATGHATLRTFLDAPMPDAK